MKGLIRIGYTVDKERWKQAAEDLQECGPVLAEMLRRMNADGRGQEDYDDFMADITLAVLALSHVAEFEADNVRIIPIREKENQ